MTKILNLDEIAPPVTKTVTIKGVSYSMKVPTMDDMVASIRSAEEFDKRFKEATDANDRFEVNRLFFESAREHIASAFPDMPAELIGQLNPDQMKALREFIDAQIEDAGEKAEDQSGND